MTPVRIFCTSVATNEAEGLFHRTFGGRPIVIRDGLVTVVKEVVVSPVHFEPEQIRVYRLTTPQWGSQKSSHAFEVCIDGVLELEPVEIFIDNLYRYSLQSGRAAFVVQDLSTVDRELS